MGKLHGEGGVMWGGGVGRQWAAAPLFSRIFFFLSFDGNSLSSGIVQ